MNARQRRYTRRHTVPLLVTNWDPNLSEFKSGPKAEFQDMVKVLSMPRRVPKLKRLAILLGLSSALLGCAAKTRTAQKPSVGKPDTFDCSHVQVKADCVRPGRAR